MANVINLQFSDTVEAIQARFEYTGDVADNTDIGWFIGTAALTTSYNNILTSGEVTTTTSPSIQANTFNRINLESATFTLGPMQWSLTNYTASLETLVIWHENNTTTPQNFRVEAFDERVNAYSVIATFSANSTTEVQKTLSITMDFFSDDFRVVNLTGTNSTEITEIYMYGKLRRKDGGSIGLLPPPAIFEDLADSNFDSSTIVDGWVNYESGINVDYRLAYWSTPITLTGTYEINDFMVSTIWVLDPNGATRDVILPQTPELDHYIRIINANGANALNIKETSAGPTIVELSNGTTILTAEFIWEQTDGIWHATY